jgi:hypothetical protein
VIAELIKQTGVIARISFLDCWSSKAIKQAETWHDGVVELHKDDDGNAHVGVDDAEQRAEA